MNVYHHIVTESEQMMRIDQLLVNHIDASRSKIQKMIANHLVTVNGTYVKANYKCQTKDVIKWKEMVEKTIKPEAESIPLSVIYEDRDMLFVNKPKGMVVHPSKHQKKGTLVNALLHYTNQLSTIGGEERPGIVHRLDKDTAGIIVIAKNDDVHQALVKQFQARRVKRIYEAVVEGVVEHETGIIDAPIGRDPSKRIRMQVHMSGKAAMTRFRTLKRYEKHSYVECELVTGRMHQIRVHMQYMGHPIVGDPLYNDQKSTWIHGQALFAKTIGLRHPTTKKWIEKSVPPPDDIIQLLHRLERNS